MAWATLNDDGVVEGRIELPRVGAWTADLVVDNDTAPSGQVTLDLNGFQLQGTVRRGGVVADASIIRVVGGAGGLPTRLDPLAYRGVPLQTPLSDALAAGGEALDAGSDQGVLQTQLQLWMRMAGPASEALRQLLRQAPGAVWRMVPGGQVWVGTETWPNSQLSENDVDFMRDDPSNGREVFFADTPSLLPGTTFRGKHVSAVEHLISRTQLRMVAWYE